MIFPPRQNGNEYNRFRNSFQNLQNLQNIFITSHVTPHLTLQNKELIDDLTKTKDELSGFNRMSSKQQIELDAAILQKNEKIKSCNRMELEVVIFIYHYKSIESKP